MPIYEYRCDDCGHAFEKLVPSHRSKPDCPECGSKQLQRLYSSFAAHQGRSASSPCQSAGQCPSARGCPSGQCPLS